MQYFEINVSLGAAANDLYGLSVLDFTRPRLVGCAAGRIVLNCREGKVIIGAAEKRDIALLCPYFDLQLFSCVAAARAPLVHILQLCNQASFSSAARPSPSSASQPSTSSGVHSSPSVGHSSPPARQFSPVRHPHPQVLMKELRVTFPQTAIIIDIRPNASFHPCSHRDIQGVGRFAHRQRVSSENGQLCQV